MSDLTFDDLTPGFPHQDIAMNCPRCGQFHDLRFMSLRSEIEHEVKIHGAHVPISINHWAMCLNSWEPVMISYVNYQMVIL